MIRLVLLTVDGQTYALPLAALRSSAVIGPLPTPGAPAVVPMAKVLATGELQGPANHSVLIARADLVPG